MTILELIEEYADAKADERFWNGRDPWNSFHGSVISNRQKARKRARIVMRKIKKRLDKHESLR